MKTLAIICITSLFMQDHLHHHHLVTEESTQGRIPVAKTMIWATINTLIVLF